MQFPAYSELAHQGEPTLLRERGCSLLFLHVTNPNLCDMYVRLHDSRDPGDLGPALHTFHVSPTHSIPFHFGHWMKFSRGCIYTITTNQNGSGLPLEAIFVNARTE